MRGTRRRHDGLGQVDGIIPAYAGNTPFGLSSARNVRDHPRVCGEHCEVEALFVVCVGSSPRMRGTRMCSNARIARAGIIPAYAGNTQARPFRRIRARDHPRVCGEHGRRVRRCPFPQGSSPRMRGTPVGREFRAVPHGIIPAYAGNTRTRHC